MKLTIVLALLLSTNAMAATPDEVQVARDAVQAAAAEVSAAGDNLEVRTEAARKLMDARKRLAALEAPTPPATPPKPASPPTSRPAAKRVVFVLDASGSMQNRFDDVRVAVRHGLERLPRDAQFNIVCDREGPTVAFKGKLVGTDDDTLRSAYGFLDQFSAHGRNNFVATVDAALKLSPDAVWILSDGDVYEDSTVESQRILRAVATVNRKRVPINTVLHFTGGLHDWDAKVQERRSFLYNLSLDSGGVCIDEDGRPVKGPPDLIPPATARPARPEKPSIFESPVQE